MHSKKSPPQKSSNHKIWQAHLKAWDSSGFSRAEYCRQQNLSYPAFKYWEKKLISRPSSPPAFVTVPAVRVEQAMLGRKEVARLKVDLGGRYRIEVYDDFSSVTLSRLLSLLAAC